MAEPLLKISFKGSEASFLQAMASKGPQIVSVISEKVQSLMFQLQSYIVREKLSGQVLNRRTGALSASVRVLPMEQEGAVISGHVAAGGPWVSKSGEAVQSPAFYAAVHEYGGTAPYSIVATKGRALAFMKDGKKMFAAHVTHPPMPARPFMAPSLDEMSGQIESEIRIAVIKVVQE